MMTRLTPLALLTAITLTAPLGGTAGLLGAQQQQQIDSARAIDPAPTTPLSLGDAVRLAAHNSASSQGARLRAVEATARVRQRRAAFLPDLSTAGSQGSRTFNTASFGIDFPTAPGQPPLFDPNGEVLGPIQAIDFRGRIAQSIFDPGAIARYRASKTAVTASTAEARAVSEQAGSTAAAAYVRAIRAREDLRARNADSVLAADLLNIARQQLEGGIGIALDVTRAQSQVAATHAQLIASRNARDRAGLDLLRAMNLPLSTQITLRDSLSTLDLGTLQTDESTAIASALSNRPDLRAADARIASARQAVSATRAERLPSLALIADKGGEWKDLFAPLEYL